MPARGAWTRSRCRPTKSPSPSAMATFSATCESSTDDSPLSRAASHAASAEGSWPTQRWRRKRALLPEKLAKLGQGSGIGHVASLQPGPPGLIDAELHERQLLDGMTVGAQHDEDAAIL